MLKVKNITFVFLGVVSSTQPMQYLPQMAKFKTVAVDQFGRYKTIAVEQFAKLDPKTKQVMGAAAGVTAMATLGYKLFNRYKAAKAILNVPTPAVCPAPIVDGSKNETSNVVTIAPPTELSSLALTFPLVESTPIVKTSTSTSDVESKVAKEEVFVLTPEGTVNMDHVNKRFMMIHPTIQRLVNYYYLDLGAELIRSAKLNFENKNKEEKEKMEELAKIEGIAQLFSQFRFDYFEDVIREKLNKQENIELIKLILASK